MLKPTQIISFRQIEKQQFHPDFEHNIHILHYRYVITGLPDLRF